ncbi:peptidylprolyl isomerase [Rubellimicrobium sp. CFH 75288]|uniref:peptidylprolyl isomerase n=1 Tax=Rubellimicrobium sp. CFH 75288 TaxID=2697034 RepID=UPI0014122E26|nr:peptidylprolyl isomerase [Rubellimicrobium sp. CFH 75288]NAZ37901.1 peptidylprolyl isomerase [Rubellimicrobium sp. CFH 75288]
MAARRGRRISVWIILGLLVLGLGGWFGEGAVRGRAGTIGSVDGLGIDAQVYANSLRNRIQAIEAQTGQPLSFAEAQALGLDRLVLGGLVAQRAMDAEAARLGLSVGDARVAEAVRASPAFAGMDGGFDREMYREQLRRNGLTEAQFERMLREDSARGVLQAAVAGGVPAEEEAAARIAAHLAERRVVTWARLPADAVPVPPLPDEAGLRAFWEAHPERFTTPERRRITYAALTPERLQAQVPVEEAELRALYESRRAEFVLEERRLVERLVYPDAAEAEAARARLDAGEAGFEALVAERGLRLSDVDLGDATRAELGGAADAVFAAEPGDVVGPLETPLGPALFRVNAVLAAQETPFEEAAPALRDELTHQAARRLIAGEIAQVEDLIAGGATPEDVAERTAFELGTMVWSEGVTEGMAAYAPFREAAAAATEGGFPRLVTLEDGGAFVLRLDGIEPPALRPFEEARADVAAAWREQARSEALLTEAERRAGLIAGGTSFEEAGLEPRQEPALTRRDFVEGTVPDFMTAAFALEPGETRVLPAADGALILRLDRVEPAAETDPARLAQQLALAAQFRATTTQDIYEAFAARLAADADLRIDEGALASVHAQFR